MELLRMLLYQIPSLTVRNGPQNEFILLWFDWFNSAARPLLFLTIHQTVLDRIKVKFKLYNYVCILISDAVLYVVATEQAAKWPSYFLKCR